MNNKNSTQYFIITVGHMASGKTTLAKKIEKELWITRVNNDDLRYFFMEKYSCYKEIQDISYRTEKTAEMNKLVKEIKTNIAKHLLEQWYSMIFDAGHIHPNSRKKIFDLKRYAKYPCKTIIINTNINELELLKRLEERDIISNYTTKWKQFYLEKKKHEFIQVKNYEADHILQYNQNNTKEIIKELEQITKNNLPT